MAKTIQSKGELWLPQDKFDNRDSSNTLEEGVEYNIIDPVGYATKKYVDDKVSTKTAVTVGGSNVATFDADTKVDKVTTTASFNRAYAITDQGAPMMINVASGSADAGSIAQRYASGRLLVGTPEVDGDAATKKYVDDKVVGNDPITTEWGSISLKFGGGLTTNNGNLEIQAGDGLTTDTGPLNISGNILNSPGLYSNTGSYIRDNYGNIEINGSGQVYTYSKNQLIYNDNFGINLTPDGIILGTYSGSTGEIDKTKPYIEITSTAVNIKGLNSIT